MITIVDYGVGNIGSIRNMLKRVGAESILASEPEEIDRAQKLILPGVGSFDHAVDRLVEKNLFSVLNRKVIEEKTPILGICLGMQLFAKKSEEGSRNGLGWLDAIVKRFEFTNSSPPLKIPHMGWNLVSRKETGGLFEGVPEDHRFYFVHSYHIVCNDADDIAGTTHYGYPFVSMVHRDNIYGVQFHPEKSHRYGMIILKNFAEI